MGVKCAGNVMNTRNARYLARNESRCCTGNYRKLLVQTGADRCRGVFEVFGRDFGMTDSGWKTGLHRGCTGWLAAVTLGCTGLHRSAPKSTGARTTTQSDCTARAAKSGEDIRITKSSAAVQVEWTPFGAGARKKLQENINPAEDLKKLGGSWCQMYTPGQ